MSTRPRLLNSDAFAHQPLWCRCVPPEHTCSLICRRKPMCTHLTGTCLHTHLYVQHICIHTSVHMHTHARYSPPPPGRGAHTHSYMWPSIPHICPYVHTNTGVPTHMNV